MQPVHLQFKSSNIFPCSHTSERKPIMKVEGEWNGVMYIKHPNGVSFQSTVEPLNKGQVGTSTNVHYSEVVLYWGVFVKNPLF